MHAHKNSMHSLPYRTNQGKTVERAVHKTTLFYKVNRPLLHYQRQRNKNDNKFKWLGLIFIFSNDFSSPWKKKETVCKWIFHRTHKVQQKKKKKNPWTFFTYQNFHNFVYFEMLIFCRLYIIKLHKTDLIQT